MTVSHPDFSILFSRVSARRNRCVEVDDRLVECAGLEPSEVERRIAIMLYDRVYLRPDGRALRSSTVAADELRRDLAVVWRTGPGWSYGWSVRQARKDGVLVQRGLDVRECAHGHYVFDRLRSPGDGDPAVDIRRFGQYIAPDGSHWIGYGPGEFLPPSQVLMVRVFANLEIPARARATLLVSRIVEALELPCAVKVYLSDTAESRADGWVFYAHAVHARAIARVVAELAHDPGVVPAGRPPLFTEVVAPGIGVADDPADGSSFGMSRCGMIARGIRRALDLRRTSRTALRGEVYRCFRERGVLTSRPYTSYPVSAGEVLRAERVQVVDGGNYELSRDSLVRAGRFARGDFVEAAARIGVRLCRESRWSSNVCTWWASDWSKPTHGVRAGTLGSGLYAGSAGVGLMLAYLYCATGEREFREHAVGALLYAGHRVRNQEWKASGLYSGAMGVAYALAVSGAALGEGLLQDAATEIAERVVASPVEHHAFDLVSGSAGSVLGLVTLARVVGRPQFLDAAVQRGRDLVALAVRGEGGAYWPCYPAEAGSGPLVGVAHGGSGVALALAELYSLTRESEFATLAREALRAERGQYDKTLGNWIDRRVRMPSSDATRQVTAVCPDSWCNGAAGIALVRAHLCGLLGGDELVADLAQAVEVTSRVIGRRGDDWSLCHGEFGRIEALRAACGRLGRAVNAQRVESRVADGVSAYGLIDRPWPCGGTPGVYVVGLMTGVAGIAASLLRCAGVDVPLVLLPGSCPEAPMASNSTVPSVASPR